MTLEEQAAALGPAEIVALLVENADLKRQVDWFKRQLFGRKSERRLREPDPQQLPLAGLTPAPNTAAEAPPPPTGPSKPINAVPGLPPWRPRPTRAGCALIPRSPWK
jgi:hypothetical protein